MNPTTTQQLQNYERIKNGPNARNVRIPRFRARPNEELSDIKALKTREIYLRYHYLSKLNIQGVVVEALTTELSSVFPPKCLKLNDKRKNLPNLNLPKKATSRKTLVLLYKTLTVVNTFKIGVALDYPLYT